MDERKERSKATGHRAKAALGQQRKQTYDTEAQLKGTINRPTHHVHRRKPLSVITVSLQVLFVVLLTLVVLWLLTQLKGLPVQGKKEKKPGE